MQFHFLGSKIYLTLTLSSSHRHNLTNRLQINTVRLHCTKNYWLCKQLQLHLVPGIAHPENPVNQAISSISRLHIIHRHPAMDQWEIIRRVVMVITVLVVEKNRRRKITAVHWQRAWVSLIYSENISNAYFNSQFTASSNATLTMNALNSLSQFGNLGSLSSQHSMQAAMNALAGNSSTKSSKDYIPSGILR